MYRIVCGLVIGGAVLVAACPAHGAMLDYSLRVGGAHSDNIRRAEENVDDQVIAMAGLAVNWSEETRRFVGQVGADIEYRDYLDDAFDNEDFASFDAELEFRLAPDLLHWIVEDKYGPLRQTPFGPDVASNRENVNTLSTGPKLTMRLGTRTTLNVDGRYEDTWFETSESDSNSKSGALSVVRALSPNRSLSLNASVRRTEFDDEILSVGFDRQSAYLGFSSEISRGTLRINLGVNELHDAGQSFSGTLAGLDWVRQVSSTSSITLGYSQQFSDAGDIFRRYDNLGSRPGEARDVVPTSDSFEMQRLSIGYNYNRNQSGLSVSLYSQKDSYQSDTQFDGRRTGGNAGASIPIGSSWKVALDARAERREFTASDRDDDYLDAGISLNRGLTRTLSLTLEYRYADRSSNRVGQSYDENRYSLWLNFDPGAIGSK